MSSTNQMQQCYKKYYRSQPSGIYLRLIKNIYTIPISNITHNVEKLEAFSLRLEKMSLLTHFFPTLVIEQVQTNTIRQKKEIKGI